MNKIHDCVIKPRQWPDFEVGSETESGIIFRHALFIYLKIKSKLICIISFNLKQRSLFPILGTDYLVCVC